jgi:hypothetical protein
MRVQVLHDRAGNIHGFLAYTRRRRGVLVPTGHDREVTEIDIPELDFELSPENHDRVAEVMTNLAKEAKVNDGQLTRSKS